MAHPAAISLLLVGATLGAFWPVLHAEFINYDDPDYVTENPAIQADLSWRGVAWAFRATHANNWHPLTWLSHMADADLFGQSPAGPHGVNLALHAANAVLLFLLLNGMTRAPGRSALVAGLFALHPLHVESVAWVAERKDVLSAFFGFLTLLAYAKYALGRGARGEGRVKSRPGVRCLLRCFLDFAVQSRQTGQHGCSADNAEVWACMRPSPAVANR